MNRRDTEPSLEREFGIFTETADLPMSDGPVYLKEGIGGVCISGTAVITVFDVKFRIEPQMIVTLLPWQLASVSEISPDFRFTFFRLSANMFADSLSSLWRLSPRFFFYMCKHIASPPKEGVIERFLNFCDLMTFRAEHAPAICRRESVMQLLRVYYWDVYSVYINDPLAEKNTKYTRKEELAFRFVRLIIEDHSLNKEVSYYASKLGVSPKYLTNLVKSVSGQSARDWIVYYTLIEIKALLRESAMDLKTIVARVDFPDQSTLSRFFRHYTGMTPTQYRKSICF